MYDNNDVLCYLHLMYNTDINKTFHEVWSDDPNLADHFVEKYNDFYDMYKAAGAPAPFYCALSTHHQQRLLAYARRYYGVE